MIDTSRILACGAHPDDIEYGCLGTILKFNPELSIGYIASCGGVGDESSGETRLHESAQALSSLTKLYTRNQIGTQDYNIIQSIEDIINKFNPTLILAHSLHDTHQDHVFLNQCVLAAARRCLCTILFYGILSNTPSFSPTLFVNISTTFDMKQKALACHKTQTDKTYMSKSYLNVFNTHQYSRLRGIEYTEAFEIFRIFS